MWVRMWNNYNLTNGTWNGTLEKGEQLRFIKVDIYLPFAPQIPLLGIYPRETKTYVHKKTSRMFRAAFFMIEKNQNT